MLHSKYLTQEGMEIMLRTLYVSGWRYIFRKGHHDEFCISEEKPDYSEYGRLIAHPQHQALLSDTLSMLIADAMKGYNYITIADHIDIVDWSTVEVDTPVLVKAYEDNAWIKRHFAFYKDGKVHTWDGGVTSWSKDSTDSTSWWTYAKLSED